MMGFLRNTYTWFMDSLGQNKKFKLISLGVIIVALALIWGTTFA